MYLSRVCHILQNKTLKYFKGIVHFEIIFCYVLTYLKGIQDVDVFVSTVFSVLIFDISELSL